MFYAISWILVVSLLALWSLGVWGVQAVGAWTLTQAGALGTAPPSIEGLQLPAWLGAWLPPELVQGLIGMLSGLGPLIDSLLQAMPALAGGLTVLAWVIWAVGAVLLLILGAVLHGLIAVWRRRGRRGPQAPTSALTTG